jgi:hypothetical protein
LPRVERHQDWERRPPRRADDGPVLRAFAPIDKRALGVAVGLVAGVALFAITAFHILFRPANALRLALLNQYFNGYEVSWRGAIVGLCWGFLTGFIAGWFLAFARNLVMAMMVFTFKIKGDLANTRDFLDHI